MPPALATSTRTARPTAASMPEPVDTIPETKPLLAAFHADGRSDEHYREQNADADRVGDERGIGTVGGESQADRTGAPSVSATTSVGLRPKRVTAWPASVAAAITTVVGNRKA